MKFDYRCEHLISPACRGYVLILVDQSEGVREPVDDELQLTKAQMLAAAVNHMLQELIIKCAKDIVIKRCFGISVISYGEHARPALKGELTGKPFVWVDELYAHPTRLDVVTKIVSDGSGGIMETRVNMPIWLEPTARGGASMHQAFTLALWLVERWVTTFTDAFFPLVVHLCGSETADGDPTPLVQRIERLGTAAGKCVVANAYLASRLSRNAVYPASAADIEDALAKRLYGMSSRLPQVMRERVSWLGSPLEDGSRAFVVNGDISDLLFCLPMNSF